MFDNTRPEFRMFPVKLVHESEHMKYIVERDEPGKMEDIAEKVVAQKWRWKMIRSMLAARWRVAM